MQKQMGAPDDAERFCVFGDSHRLAPADGAVEVSTLLRTDPWLLPWVGC